MTLPARGIPPLPLRPIAGVRIRNARRAAPLSLAALVFLAVPAGPLAQSADVETLIDFAGPFDMKTVSATDAVASLAGTGPQRALSIAFGRQSAYPGITLVTPSRNLAAYAGVAMEIKNTGTAPLGIIAEVDGHRWTDAFAWIEAGKTRTLAVPFKRSRQSPTPLLSGMDGLPGDYQMLFSADDPVAVKKLRIYVERPGRGGSVEIASIRAQGKAGPPPDSVLRNGFFPFIDAYGQYAHADWPGKIHKDADLAAALGAEAGDLRANPEPPDRDPYGGWAAGPLLAATGHFRTEKVQGKWWLVDPLGRLFWSSGIAGVQSSQATSSAGRQHYFAAVPEGSVPGGDYDFYAANLRKKYGTAWETEAGKAVHARLRSWGINTLGNWSAAGLRGMHQTPYVVALGTLGVPKLSTAAFRADFHARLLAEKAYSGEDPWCIGYFVDNEIHNWPADSLQQVAERYYRTVQEEIRAVTPHKLYLGSRLDYHFYPDIGSPVIVAACAKYCDVISFNRYRYSASELVLPPGLDKPVLIGEFHMGATDRGMPHTGLRSVGDQAQRGEAYAYYLRTALDNPGLVGVHWFSYVDQPYTGRSPDGENFNIGWVDVGDTPYPEMVRAGRRANYGLYAYRYGGTTALTALSGSARGKADREGAAAAPRHFDILGRDASAPRKACDGIPYCGRVFPAGPARTR